MSDLKNTKKTVQVT